MKNGIYSPMKFLKLLRDINRYYLYGSGNFLSTTSCNQHISLMIYTGLLSVSRSQSSIPGTLVKQAHRLLIKRKLETSVIQ